LQITPAPELPVKDTANIETGVNIVPPKETTILLFPVGGFSKP
tara:strand:- start:295 stop:423 length:129 start_codon:yes stop_codon:yes gene_type:complete